MEQWTLVFPTPGAFVEGWGVFWVADFPLVLHICFNLIFESETGDRVR